MMQVGQAFQTADGALSFAEFGELVSTMWMKANPDVPMFPAGTPTDEMPLPHIIWSCAGRRRIVAAKGRLAEEFVGEDGRIRSKRINEHLSVFQAKVVSGSPKEANQLIEVFERFMDQYTGAFKQLGLREIVYLQRLADDEGRYGAQPVAFRTSQWEVYEQSSAIEFGNAIEEVAVTLREIRSRA